MTPTRFRHRPALSVLVVDADRASADRLACLLRERGHEARTAGTGLDAVAAAVERPFDVIVLGANLPGLTGYDLARWVRRHRAARPPYLVAVVGREAEDGGPTAAEAGIDLFLSRPLDPTALGDLLARAGR